MNIKQSNNEEYQTPFIVLFSSIYFLLISYTFLYGLYIFYLKDKLSYKLFFFFFESDSPVCIGLFIFPLIVFALEILVRKNIIQKHFALMLGFSYCFLFCLTGLFYSIEFIKPAYYVYVLSNFWQLLSHPIHSYSIFLFSLSGLIICIVLMFIYAFFKKLNTLFWTLAFYGYFILFLNFINPIDLLYTSIFFLSIFVLHYSFSFFKPYHLVFTLWAFMIINIICKQKIIFKWFVYGFPAIFGGCISSLIFLFTCLFLSNKLDNSITKATLAALIFCFFYSLLIGIPLKAILGPFIVFLIVFFLLRQLLFSEENIPKSHMKFINVSIIAGLFIFFPIFSNVLYFIPEYIEFSSEAKVISKIDHPHSIILSKKGYQAFFTADKEIHWIDFKKDQHKIVRTKDYIRESQHMAISLDEKNLYLVSKTYDSVIGINLARSFQDIRFIRPVNLSFPRHSSLYGTSWPFITQDNFIIVSENGFIVRCPFDKNVPCQSIHFSYSESSTTLIESIGGKTKNYIETDAVILTSCLKKIYVVINDPPYGVLVFETSSLTFIHHILKGYNVEYLMLHQNSLYCSIPKKGKIAIINIKTDELERWADAFIGVNAIVYSQSNDCFYASGFHSPYIYESKALKSPFQKKWRVSRIIKNMAYNPAKKCILVVGRDSNRVFEIDN